ILIVNHHLYFTNLIAGGGVLPQAEVLVFDEAHNLEDVATDYLGLEFSDSGWKFLLDSVYNPNSGKGLLSRLNFSGPGKLEKSEKALENARRTGKDFFRELSDKFPKGETVLRLHSTDFISNTLNEPLIDIISSLNRLLDKLKDDDDRFELSAYIQRLDAARSALRKILEQQEEGFVYWAEAETKRARPKYSLRAAPINVGAALQSLVFDKTEHVILTSATLTTEGNFKFIKSRLGLKNSEEIILGSPFNYQEQAILYLQDGISDPGTKHEEYINSLAMEIEALLEITGGRAFVLFTSYEDLDRIYSELSTRVSKYPILRQGDMSSYRLLKDFKEVEGSVLLGTSTFWQGVDVPGTALECVIITRLPFSVPNEPVVEARLEELKRQGENPFLQYQVPQAILRLKQGFGRLIRRKDDFGIVAILDPRIRTRHYGRMFLDSLPPCRQVSSLKEAEAFLNLLQESKKIGNDK
ncbi:MAG: helicase c2, partial [Candidatus Omnitrophica bacterium]|nr:helicase c2 [Candidatus Omnitrophota bacterium]